MAESVVIGPEPPCGVDEKHVVVTASRVVVAPDKFRVLSDTQVPNCNKRPVQVYLLPNATVTKNLVILAATSETITTQSPADFI